MAKPQRRRRMPSDKLVKCRLAMRVEGDTWVAYYAQPDSMQGAIWLGAIKMALVVDRGRRETFMEIMKDAISDVLADIVGEHPTWPTEPEPAPESEKSGSA